MQMKGINMKQRTKTLITSALLLVMSSFCVSGCDPGKTIQSEPPDVPVQIETTPEPTPYVVLPTETSRDLGLFEYNGMIVDENREEAQGFVLNDDGHVVNTSGEIVIAAKNLNAYSGISCANAVNESDLRHTVDAFAISGNELEIEPFLLELRLKISDDFANDTHFSAESPNPVAVYFPYDANTEHIQDVEVPPDGVLPRLDIDPNENGEATIYIMCSIEGKYPLIFRDYEGNVTNAIDIDIIPEYIQTDILKTNEENAVDEHDHDFDTATIEATAVSEGYTQYSCRICGYTYRDEYKLRTECEHKYADHIVPATYATNGYTLHVCEICGHTYIDGETEKLECDHSKTIDKVIKPTCTEQGYTYHECMICWNHSFEDSFVPPLGHNWNNGRVTVRPTCAEPGERTFTCVRCKAQKVEEEPATGKHQYKRTITKPTCTEKGFTTYTCAVCGDQYEDNFTEPHGHKAVLMWTVTEQPTCGRDGSKSGTCPWCNEVVKTEVVPATGRHSYTKQVVDPTETEDGYTEYTCSVCGYSYKDNITPATGK